MGEDVQFRAGIRVFEEESLNALENIGNDKEYEQSLCWLECLGTRVNITAGKCEPTMGISIRDKGPSIMVAIPNTPEGLTGFNLCAT